MKREPNEGGRQLVIAIERANMTRMAAEDRCEAARGLFTRLISGERKPGRALGERIRKEFGVGPDLWDVPARVAYDPRAKTGTEG